MAGANGSAATDPKLTALREAMSAANGGQGVHAYIVPSEDPHMSEYAPVHQERRRYVSNFTGSAGTALLTEDKALLWTDGRYFLQAEQQLGPDWTLQKADTPGVLDLPTWLAKNMPAGARVGVDPLLHTIDGARKLQKALEGAGHELVPVSGGNLVDAIWSDRPQAPMAKTRVHPTKLAGVSVQDKLKLVREDLKEQKVGALIVTALDEVAWLLNLRGGDVAYNPIFISYVIVTPDTATLYVDSAKITTEVAEHLADAAVTVQPYEKVLEDVEAAAEAGTRIWMDPSQVSFALAQAASGASAKRGTKRKADGGAASPEPVLEARSPVTLRKAIKNETELDGIREAHLRDAVAIVEFLTWLDEKIAGGATITEVEVDEKLTARRAAQQGFNDCSFPTIAGAGPNGAIIHYRAEAKTAGTVDKDTHLLIDSGGQYDCGTTDITRTMHFGQPTAHQKRCFTRVLQGHIALDSAVFPPGTPGLALDTLARKALWADGLDYRHGTGHGVGAALNVHEGPHSISKRYYITQPLQAGMIVSNEPGYYEDGNFGVRIENLLTIKEADTKHQFGGKAFLNFDRLTVVPLQQKMIDMEVLNDAEKAWVDAYHKEVWEKVSPRLSGAPLEWLKSHTQPLSAAQPVAA
jgi:Xaa-Pro aminopeptidase